MSDVIYNPTTGRFEEELDANEVSAATDCALGYVRQGMNERNALHHTFKQNDSPTFRAAVVSQFDAVLAGRPSDGSR